MHAHEALVLNSLIRSEEKPLEREYRRYVSLDIRPVDLIYRFKIFKRCGSVIIEY